MEKLKNLSDIDYVLKDILTIQICFNKEEFIQIADSASHIQSYGFDITLLEGYEEVSRHQKEVSKDIYGGALISGTLFLNSE